MFRAPRKEDTAEAKEGADAEKEEEEEEEAALTEVGKGTEVAKSECCQTTEEIQVPLYFRAKIVWILDRLNNMTSNATHVGMCFCFRL